jgi:hypothetical protein
MDPHAPNLWHMSDDPSMPYSATLNIILSHFNLAMKLANPAWNGVVNSKKGTPKSLDR